jgi:RsiW-degrading membrane proteinase PrsW (M82 family)
VRSLFGIVSLVLCASAFGGVAAWRVVQARMTPDERARTLVQAGRYADAERQYLELASRRPASLPAIVELIDVHHRMDLFRALGAGRGANGLVIRGADDRAVTSVIAAPDLPAEVRLLARFWDEVARGEVDEADRAAAISTADSSPPAAWANHLLAREDEEDGDDGAAAERHAREATSFDGRAEDADAACGEWIAAGDLQRLSAALRDGRFARQVSAELRMRQALSQRDWWGALRWFLPSQYERATPGLLLLAVVSGAVWFALCAQIGLIGERPRFRAPLQLVALVAGVLSTYLTLAVGIVEHAWGFVETGHALPDAIYFVVGVGLREELCKALFVLPFVPLLVRWGTRRDALACGAMVGLGFAVEENIGYFHGGLSTALARFLTANFLHVSTTGLVAVALFDDARSRGRSDGTLSGTVMTVIVAHGLYDFFLSSSSVDGGSVLSMFVFVLLTRRFVEVLRSLPGRERPLLSWFCVGLAVVAGASFIYASAAVGPLQGAMALAQGALGLSIVAAVFVQQLRSI